MDIVRMIRNTFKRKKVRRIGLFPRGFLEIQRKVLLTGKIVLSGWCNVCQDITEAEDDKCSQCGNKYE